ncbi:hypothetical protein J4206_07180 [Candidatus Woesearchaeota archaeon]|nr:hypothetical protein [Candidatus Woesearchaeota archaeon]
MTEEQKSWKKNLERILLSSFGTESEVRSLGSERVTNIGLYKHAGILLGSLAGLLCVPEQYHGIALASMCGYHFMEILRRTKTNISRIGSIRTRRVKKRIIAHLNERVEGSDYDYCLNEFEIECSTFGLPFYHPTECALFILNKEIESKQLKSLLREARVHSVDLPTVGAELEYATEISRKKVVELNDIALLLRPHMPASYTTREKSEIRFLPSNPYTFRWYVEEVFKRLPEDKTPKVMITMQDVNKERTPYVLLALYFSSPSCVLPFVETKEEGHSTISFPGVYVGQTTRDGKIEVRGQTNYSVMHSKDPCEIANVAFFTSKLHSMSDDAFKEFAKDITAFLGLDTLRFKSRMEFLSQEKTWNGEYGYDYTSFGRFPTEKAYSLPECFVRETIVTAKTYLGIRATEQHFPFYTYEEEERIREINRNVQNILEQHTVTTPEDIMYSTPLEMVMNERTGLMNAESVD